MSLLDELRTTSVLVENMIIRYFAIPLLFFVFTLNACKEEATPEPPKIKNRRMEKKNTGHYTGQILEKSFINKVGKAGGRKDLYIRLSMGDYFIKFCESSILQKDLAGKVDSYITFKGDIKDGEWDSCPGDTHAVQSRTGPYITVKELLE